MSIVTLKKKTSAKYNYSDISSKNGSNVSGQRTQGSFLSQGGFSLNGTRRSQGYVGQDTLGRSLPKTIMKGNVIKGHGGSNGTFIKQPIVQSAVTSLNNPTVVKPSVMNNSGQLMTQFRWIRRPAPFSVVKPDNTLNSNTQQEYIHQLQQTTITNANNNACQKYPYSPVSCKNILNSVNNNQNLNYQPNSSSDCAGTTFSSKKFHVIMTNPTNNCNITKDLENVTNTKTHSVPMSGSDHLLQLDNKCSVNNIFQFTKNTQKTPFPGFV